MQYDNTRSFFTIIVLLGIFVFVSPQYCDGQEHNFNRGGVNEVFGGSYNFAKKLNLIPYMSKGPVGSSYYYDEWKSAKVYFYSAIKSLDQYKVKLNLKNNTLEVKDSKGIKAINGHWIRKIEVDPMVADSCMTLLNWHEVDSLRQKAGFIEELVQGKFKLYCSKKIVITSANYNIALDVGDRDGKVLKKNEFYLKTPNGRIIKITRKKKLLYNSLGDHGAQIKEYMKKRHLKCGKREDLIKIINYCNSLCD